MMETHPVGRFLFAAALLALLAGGSACSSGLGQTRPGHDPDESVPGELSRGRQGNRSAIFHDEMSHPKIQPTMVSSDTERAADNHFRRGNVEMAYIQYTKTLRDAPDNTRVRYKRGLVFLVGGMHQRARDEFERVLRMESDHAPAVMGLGQVHFELKEYDEAEACFRRALAMDPELWKACAYLGVIHDYRGEHEVAILKYRRAIEIRPENGLLYNNLGLSYYLQGDYETSIQAFRKAMELSPSKKRISNNLGLALFMAGRTGEALEAFRLGGDEAQAFNNLGCLYQIHGRTDLAVESFEKAIERKPGFYTQANENLKKALAAR